MKLHLKMMTVTATMAAVCCTGFSTYASESTDLNNIGASGFYVADEILYMTDSYTNQVFQYDGSEMILLAGNPNWQEGIPNGGYHNGIAKYILFDDPFMAVPWNEGVIVSDTKNQVLRFIQNEKVITYAGIGEAGYLDGMAQESAFYLPTGLSVDPSGNLYVADTGNGVIRKITADGQVSTYYSDMKAPMGLYWYDNALYVTDAETNQICCVKEGVMTVIAGQGMEIDGEWVSGYTNGPVEEATFSLPQSIFIDESGIYIGDVGNNAVRLIKDGQVSTYFEQENVADPVAITKYQDKFYIGDPFMKSIQMVELSAMEFKEENQVQKTQEVETTEDTVTVVETATEEKTDVAEMAIEEEEIDQVEKEGNFFIWIEIIMDRFNNFFNN